MRRRYKKQMHTASHKSAAGHMGTTRETRRLLYTKLLHSQISLFNQGTSEILRKSFESQGVPTLRQLQHSDSVRITHEL